LLNKLTQWLLFQPLKTKILGVIMTVVIITVVSIAGFLYWHNDQQHRQSFIRNNLLLVKLVGQYTTLPLVFNDKAGAEEQLSKLLQDSRIAYVRLENANGEIMTNYDPVNIASESPLMAAGQEYIWHGNKLYFNISISHNQQNLGLLKGAFHLDEYRELQRLEMVFIIAAVLVAVICSFVLSLLLRQFVMSSIQRLETHARRIARQPGRDELFTYPKRQNDEISRLSEAFNFLMQQVRSREAEILQLNSELENKVRQRTEELSAALRIKSAFLANMSHEIRTPMNAILGMLHLVLQTELSAKQRSYIIKANDAAKWLLGIINDILDYSKLESGKISLELKSFRLDTVIKYLADVTTPLLNDKPVDLRFAVDPNIPLLVGDQLRLGQVLLNLISNAIKFTEAGTITVQIKPLTIGAEDVNLLFNVIDTGIGISEEQQERLFEPFTQADDSTTRQYGGTGLGLTICKELVEAMGGRISIESRVGLGSRFSFTIKLGLASNGRLAKALPAEAPAYHWSDLEGVHLLVVEDNPVNQELVQEVLRNHGLIVDLACNGAEALELVAKHEYATVLMDCLMPVMDGFIATETIRKNPRFADLPIIAMTANVMAEEKQRCLASGMNDHIGKPIHWDQLLEKLGHWTKPRSLRELGLTPEKRGVAGDFPALAGVDRNLARNGVSGDAGLYCRLLRTLRQQHADTISMIKSAYAAGDYQAAAQQAHALSGALSAIGAAQLSALMKALQEQFIEDPSRVLVEPMMNHAELGFNKLMHEIDGLIVPAGQ